MCLNSDMNLRLKVKLTSIFSKQFIVLLLFSFLTACASKPEIDEPELDPLNIQQQKETEQFEQALGIIQTENVQEKDLLKAKNILDSLYQTNHDYLGALINSADISLKLERLDEAKALYLEVIQTIEQRTDHVQASGSSQEINEIPEQSNLFATHSYNQLGLIGRQQGQFDEAESYYRKALDIDSDNIVSLKNLAILLDLYRGRLADAMGLYEHYQRLVGESDPNIKDWIYDLKNRLPTEAAGNE